jgi:hypothetical protein
VITPSVTVTVEPGVVVMGNNNTELKVRGHLQAVGTPTQPITFTSATDSGPTQWAGLVFDGGACRTTPTYRCQWGLWCGLMLPPV